MFVLIFPVFFTGKRVRVYFTGEILGGKRLGGHNGHAMLSHVSKNILLLSPGTMHTFVCKYGFHPPLLSLAQRQAIAIVPVHGSSHLVTVLLRAKPFSVDQDIVWL